MTLGAVESDLGAAVVTDRRTGNDGVDRIAGRPRIAEAFQDHGTDAVGEYSAVRSRIEWPALAIGSTDTTRFIEITGRFGLADGNCTGHCHLAFTRQQCLNGEMHRHEPGGAGCLDANTRTVKIEVVSDTRCDHAGNIAEPRLQRRYAVAQGRVGMDMGEVIIQRTADINTRAAPAFRASVTGMFQRVPGAFQKHPLLRVEQLRLPWRISEKPGIESGRVAESAPDPDIVGLTRQLTVDSGAFEIGIRYRRQSRTAIGKQLPETINVISTGKTACKTDDGYTLILTFLESLQTLPRVAQNSEQCRLIGLTVGPGLLFYVHRRWLRSSIV